MRYFAIGLTVSVVLLGLLLSPLLATETDGQVGSLRVVLFKDSGPPITAELREGAYRQLRRSDANAPFERSRSDSPTRTAQYSFCGACTDNDACGPGNICCRGDCPEGKKKCYAAST